MKSEKTLTATLLLCLFLGGFGAHRFYAWKTGTAIAQLLLTITIVFCWVSAIWAFVDLIMIATGGFKDSTGAVIK